MLKKCFIYKYCSILLIAVLFIGMSVPVSAASKVVFTAVNDQFLDLSDFTMPVEKDGKYYVPYTVFLSGFGGIKAYYSAQEQVLVLYDKTKVISFDLAHGYTYDQQMRTYDESAFTKNGTVFIPVSFICTTWGFYCSVISSSRGEVVRISRSSPSLSDGLLISFGDSVMASLLAQYNKDVSGTTEPANGETPAVPARKIVYLSFDASPGEATEDILNALSSYRYSATFFLSDLNVTGRDDLVRQIIVDGHSIGLNARITAADSEKNSSDAIVEQLINTNSFLEKTARMKTRIIRVTDAGLSGLSEEMRDAFYLSGYRLWDYTIDATVKNTAASISSAVTGALKKTSRPAVVMMGNRTADAKALNAILSYLKQNNYVVLAINDWDTPVNAYQDIR